ncbi:MAG TPA: hypothetical protein VLN48_00860 [Bryobacteraceae bacterium]|nr:hypothetical protein [Bryobacteraceae bacterium]
MSRYSEKPLSFEGLKTVPLAARGGKVRVEDFARPFEKGGNVTRLIESFPAILAGQAFRGVLDALKRARAGQRAILWGMGGHVIKCGLGDILLDLMRRGWVSAWVMNGAASIHDFEIAIAGHTSEDVEAVLPDGRFGSAEETGREMNAAIHAGNRDGLGMGESLGRHLELARPASASHSVLAGAYGAAVPVTVHVAIGTDTPHTHPQADGAAIGATSHRDFQLLCALVRTLDNGGVYLNLGSAVVLPEVFLKAVSVVRNLGYPLAEFTTVNFDFLQHYRPRVNVVERPHVRSGGHGFALTGHHEIMIPLLAAALVELS